MSIIRFRGTVIRELLEDFPAVCVLGPRQCGKTTLVKMIAEEHEDAVYLDLESPRDMAKLQEPELFFEQNAYRLVVLDEIQREQNLFKVLRSVIDRDRRPGRFLLTGSASPGLLQEGSESLAGRIAFEELAPLHWFEVKDSVTVNQLWLNGGFPDALLAKKEKVSMRWRMDFIRTYLERELPLLGLQTQLDKLRPFVSMLMHQQGQLLNREALSRSIGTSADTVSRYLEYLESAFLIRSLQPYYTNIGKRLVKSPKVFIRDSGLLHTLAGISTHNDLLGHPLAGGSWEGFVIEQIHQILDDDVEVYFYRTYQGTEADLVLVKNQKPVVTLEVKLSLSPSLSKGFYTAIGDLDTKNNLVVIPGFDSYPLNKNVQVIGFEQFIDKMLSGSII
jgi:predicted AAA+ superfamily ATPase